MILEAKIGCRVFKEINSTNIFRDHGMHLSKEWINCKISSDAGKAVAQKLLRKKVVKHANSKAHLTANKIYLEREKETIENATISSMHHQREATERCIGVVYHIAYKDRPYTDYETLVSLQFTNGLEMGRTLQSRWSCTEMIDIVKDAMANKLINEIIGNQKKGFSYY